MEKQVRGCRDPSPSTNMKPLLRRGLFDVMRSEGLEGSHQQITKTGSKACRLFGQRVAALPHNEANPMTNYQQTVAVLLAALSAVLYIAAMPTESAKIKIGSNYIPRPRHF